MPIPYAEILNNFQAIEEVPQDSSIEQIREMTRNMPPKINSEGRANNYWRFILEGVDGQTVVTEFLMNTTFALCS